MNIGAILLGALFAYVSTFVAYHGIKHCLDCVRMFRADRCSPGIVTEIRTEQSWRKGRSRTTYSAVITYYTAWHEKREVEYADPIGSNAFKVGDRLTIWYDVNDPEIFTLGGWHFVKDIASFVIIVVFLGLPGWGVLCLEIKQYIHF